MDNDSERGDDPDATHRFRRHLSVIQAQAELLLDDPAELSSDREDALRRIQRVSTELTTLVEQTRRSGPTHIQAVPDSAVPETVRRILVCTTNQYLSELLSGDSSYHNGIEVIRMDSIDDARAILSDRQFDYALADAVWPDGTGIDLFGSLSETEADVPPYVLLSVYTATGTPLALALSGVLSPTIDPGQLDRTLQPYVDDPGSATISGFLSERPGDGLGARLADDSAIGDVSEAMTALANREVDADVVCLDPAVYRQLSDDDIARIRTVSPGRGRPLLLVASTDRDLYDRSWIPTLGSRQFLHRPPDLSDLITQLLAQRPYQAESPSDQT